MLTHVSRQSLPSRPANAGTDVLNIHHQWEVEECGPEELRSQIWH
ncbi:MAG: hypothetical protein Q7U57_18825 [Methylovulum sp.]|nr:hypothetical protein [Methylovulum sp.]